MFGDSETETEAADELQRRYLARAAERVEELRPEPGVGNADPGAVEKRVQQALEDDAVHELREIVSQIRGGLEIAERGDGSGDEAIEVPRDRVEGFMQALDRAEAVLETHLDRSTMLQLMVRLEPERFDLTHHLSHFLSSHGLDPSTAHVRGEFESAPVRADRRKVVEGLGHAALHLFQQSPQESVLVVSVGPDGSGGVDGRFTIDPAPFDREALVKELDRPFRLETVEIDLPYVRAVMERHGGGIQVVEDPDGGLGYGFRLPAEPPEVPA